MTTKNTKLDKIIGNIPYAIPIILALTIGVSSWINLQNFQNRVAEQIRQDKLKIAQSKAETEAIQRRADEHHKCMVNVIARVQLGRDASATECNPEARKQEAEIRAEMKRILASENKH